MTNDNRDPLGMYGILPDEAASFVLRMMGAADPNMNLALCPHSVQFGYGELDNEPAVRMMFSAHAGENPLHAMEIIFSLENLLLTRERMDDIWNTIVEMDPELAAQALDNVKEDGVS